MRRLTPKQKALVFLAEDLGFGAAIRLIRQHQRECAKKQPAEIEPTEDDMEWAAKIDELEGAA